MLGKLLTLHALLSDLCVVVQEGSCVLETDLWAHHTVISSSCTGIGKKQLFTVVQSYCPHFFDRHCGIVLQAQPALACSPTSPPFISVMYIKYLNFLI